MLPDLHVLGLSIQTFGLAVIGAFLIGTLLVAKRLHEMGRNPALANEGVFVAAVSGIAGAHLAWLIPSLSTRPGDALDAILSGGGLVWYGGLLAGAVAVTIWTRWRGLFELRMADLSLTAVAAAQAVGRIGCQLSGDGDYGVRSDLPWAMGYPDGTVPTPPGVSVHPTPIYEALALAALAVWMWRKRDSFRPGVLAASYLIGAGVERLLVELIRRNETVLAGLTAAQLWSIVSITAGATMLAIVRRKTPAVQLAR